MSISTSPQSTVQTVSVRAGLCVLRYHSAENKNAPPSIYVERPRSGERIETVAEPGSDDWNLEKPGDCLVLKVPASAKLLLHISPRERGSVKTTVKLEYLTAERLQEERRPRRGSSGFSSTAGSDPRSGQPSIARHFESPHLRLLAHVSRMGDVRVGEGEWIAGPDRPLPIEGLQFDFDEAAPAFELRYAAVNVNEDLRQARLRGLGEFVGTRARARPLTGLYIEINPALPEFTLEASALFFGTPIRKAAGSSLTLSGPTGREALLGLRFAIKRTKQVDTTTDSGNNSDRSEDVQTSGRNVLVFR